MDDLTKKKIEQSIADRKAVYSRFLENCKTFRPFLEVEKAAFADGSLGVKTKELMALCVSIVTKCEPCMEWHVKQALAAGAMDAEIYETIDVAVEMGGGPASAAARFALAALDYHKKQAGS